MSATLMKHGLTGLRRSRTYFRSLGDSNDSLSTSTTASTAAYPVHSLQAAGLRLSSLSLYLNALNSSQLHSSSSLGSLGSSSSNLKKLASGNLVESDTSESSDDDRSVTPFKYEASFPPSCHFVDADSKALARWILMFVVCLQAPTYLQNVLSILESNAVPVLVMLGTLPAMVHARLKTTASSLSSTSLSSVSSLLSKVSSSGNASLRAMEELYRNHSYGSQSDLLDTLSPSPVRRTSRSGEAYDEWGHFADFDEALHEADALCS